jgi:hypothetical protein
MPGFKRIGVAFALLAAGLAGAARASGGFSFWDAEFMPPDRALAAAEQFIESDLPPGLPMAEARARLRKAAMVCDQPEAPGAPVTCDCSEILHLEGGVLGEDHWTVVLVPDAAGRLGSASLDHHIIGSGPPNPQ